MHATSDNAYRERLWAAVDVVLDAAPSVADLREHGLDLLAARRRRLLGLDVADELLAEERRAAACALAVAPLLERIVGVLETPPILVKGPELAARYPAPALRRFVDIDLIVDDRSSAQRSLLEAGFREVGDPELFRGIHHLRPLVWPGLPLAVELHSEPKWIQPGPPTYAELAERAEPAACGVDGVLAPCPADHAVLVAVHSWAHEPLRRVSDLIDVAVLLDGEDRAQPAVAAERMGVSRLWATTLSAVEATFFAGRSTFASRTWARDLATARRRTVLESHLESLLSPFGARPPLAAGLSALAAGADILLPAPGEAWPRKLRRARVALRDAGDARTEHDRALDRRGLL